MSTTTLPTLLIVIASSRPGRQGDAWGAWVAEYARHHGGFRVKTVDLAELGLPFMDEPNHPRARKYTKDHTKVWSQMVESADAFVFVTPEYNFSFNAVLKNALDYLFVEWNDKPAGILSYGGASGGMRATQALKQVLGALGLVVPSAAVAVPFSRTMVDDRGRVDATDHVKGAANAMLDEVERLDKILRPERVARAEEQARAEAEEKAAKKSDKAASKA